MLRIWQMHKAELHTSVANLLLGKPLLCMPVALRGVSVRPGDKTPVMERT